MVLVRFYGRLADILGAKEVRMDNVSTLKELVERLQDALGDKASALIDENGEFRPGILVLINGEAAVFRGGMKARLGEGDSVVFDTIDIYEVEGGG